ncbi:hypothetical protein MTBBW1_1810002 [Desulfamplus magnetovallimortis]|uniref:Uncharacterized protein n=1 Tax=Desulfamplus magnetovallimortis TaxID=1246637 RepID=A0A1W1HAH3_9BACT|nr:hypothetical protein MTBBW1_1810002 [Desulfamplus magnetovallimortis]
MGLVLILAICLNQDNQDKKDVQDTWLILTSPVNPGYPDSDSFTKIIIDRN